MGDEWTVHAAFPRPSCSIPNYDLLSRIGSSDHGEVWLARHQVLPTFRAVKIVRPQTAEAARHLEKEIAGVRCFEPVSREHEGLMDLLEVGELPDHAGFWYAMELADPDPAPEATKSTGIVSLPLPNGPPPGTDAAFPGGYRPRTLASELARRGRFTPRETLEIGLWLAEALAYLHSRQPPLVHRDLKPENVIYVGGQLKLADPGLVSWSSEHATWCGTPGYVAPEGPGRPAADVFSLGKTLYAMLTGFSPYRFPETPSLVDSPADSRLWGRLNAVLCHACENAPTERYPSGVELRDDLARIRAGREPRLRRSAAFPRLVGVAVLTAAFLSVLWVSGLNQGGERIRSRLRGVGSAETARLGRPVFQDHFLDQRLNPELWTWNFWQTNARPQMGQASRQVSVANGTLQVENRVLHEEGWNIKQHLWVLSRHDLRPLGDTWLEAELSGRAANAHFKLALTAGDGPWLENGQLIGLYERGGGRFQPAQIERMRVEVELSLASGLALVRWTEPDGPRQRLVDVAGLPAWRLVFFTAADSAEGMGAGEALLTVHRVRACPAQLPRRLMGWVTLARAGVPVGGLEVANRWLGQGTVTDREGAFVLPAEPGWNEVEIRDPAYRPMVKSRPVQVGRSGFARCALEVLKTNPDRGDVVAVQQLSRRPLARLAVGPHHVYALSESGLGNALYRYDRHSAEEEFLGPLKPDIGLCWAAGKLFATGTGREARLFEVNLEPPPAARACFDLPTPWPVGLAWDGTNFWFAEFNDQHTNRFGVYAVEGQSGQVRVHLPTSDTRLCDVAWGAGRLWLTSATAGLYEVDPVQAQRGGTLEAGIVTNYPGLYGDIEFADGHLWLLTRGTLLQIRVQ
jgi:hypothetical protein